MDFTKEQSPNDHLSDPYNTSCQTLYSDGSNEIKAVDKNYFALKEEKRRENKKALDEAFAKVSDQD